MENKRLIKFQKNAVFVDPKTAYENAGVELVDLDVIWQRYKKVASKMRQSKIRHSTGQW